MNLHLPALAFLLAISTPCFAMMEIDQVTPARAKELGMEIHTNSAGPGLIRVELSFDAKGTLKNFTRVDMEMSDAGKLQLTATLKEEKSTPGHIVVGFAADRAQLDTILLRVVTEPPSADPKAPSRTRTGYDLRLKDFTGLPKPAAVAPEEEARFLAVIQKAYDSRDASLLTDATCWDRVPDKIKQSTQSTYAVLVAEKGVVYDFKLVDPDLQFVGRDHIEDGIAYRPNLAITRQLNMRGADPKDKKRTLFVLTYAVGQKDGKLFLLGSAPVK